MGEGGGHAAGHAGAAEHDDPAAGREAQLAVRAHAVGVGVEASGEDEDSEAAGGDDGGDEAALPGEAGVWSREIGSRWEFHFSTETQRSRGGGGIWREGLWKEWLLDNTSGDAVAEGGDVEVEEEASADA